MSTEGASLPTPGRLRYRCRRGMKELDRLLVHYVDAHAPGASASELAAFDAMLDAQDPELWDWFVGRRRPERSDWQSLVEKIRASYRP